MTTTRHADTSPECASLEPLTVHPAEAGQKLLQFLIRRFAVPQSLAHRWIRSGQVRINGKRCKPFDRVLEGDSIRVPPAALRGLDTETAGTADTAAISGTVPEQAAKQVQTATLSAPLSALDRLRGQLPVIAVSQDILVIDKPAGLPVHPGSGHSDSVTTRLKQVFAAAPFMPTPAHRLDAATSGILLVATSYSALRALHEAFAEHDALRKDYLAWLAGQWPGKPGERTLLEDRLSRVKRAGTDRAACRNADKDGNTAKSKPMERIVTEKDGQTARAEITLLRHAAIGEQQASLVRVRLLTGRTHQIRVQLSSRGHPVLGDAKYGGTQALRQWRGQHPPLYLHAARLVVPRAEGDGEDIFSCLPAWKGVFQIYPEELG